MVSIHYQESVKLKKGAVRIINFETTFFLLADLKAVANIELIIWVDWQLLEDSD